MQTYIVQSGDTLSGIASRYSTSVDDLINQNDQITDPDYIRIGWELKVPSSKNRASLPAPQVDPDDPSSETAVSAPCGECVVDVMHVTGSADESWCEALPETAAEEILKEVGVIEALMEEYRGLSSAVPEPDLDDYEQKIIEHRQKKNEWLKKAVEAGILEQSDAEQAVEPRETSERQKLEAELAELRSEIRFYENYRPFRMLTPGRVESDANTENENWKLLQTEKLRALSAEEAKLEERLAATPSDDAPERRSSENTKESGQREAAESGEVSEYQPFTGGVSAKNMSGSGGSVSSSKKTGRAGQDRIVEVMLFSKGNRLSYVRKDFLRQFRTRNQLISIRKTEKIASMLGGQRSDLKIGDLVGQVADQIKESRRKGKLGDVSIKLAEWTLDGKDAPEWVQFLQSEHKTLWKTQLTNGDSDETTTMALDSEGHFMRFAAKASSDIDGFDPATGSVDVGVKAEASMSLLEGKVELTGYLPNKAGWDCSWTYIDANGKPARQSFGKFRFEGQTVLSCFVGAKASGQAKAGVSGANMLLSSAPGIKSESSELGGGAKISGNAFAGGEAGGELAGKLGWKAPVAEDGKKKEFSDLLELKASGLVAFGAGAGLDFECKIDRFKNIEVHGSGRLVFGPGASGGFGTTISADKIWDLCSFVFSALRESDYRFLSNVQKDLFFMLSRGFIVALTEPAVSLSDLLMSGYQGLEQAWRENQIKQNRAENLAENISTGRWRASFSNGTGNFFSIDDLPPEALGPCCYELTERFLLSREEVQEKSLVFLLSSVVSWRHFIETLEHMSADGSKKNAMESLARIQAMLDFSQQTQFDEWIKDLRTVDNDRRISWTPKPASEKYEILNTQIADLRSMSRQDFFS
jgi:murein DD-endopeptidase MepM/ murein hydrolase activator NlpD